MSETSFHRKANNYNEDSKPTQNLFDNHFKNP